MGLLTAYPGQGGEHAAELDETGIATCLDVLKRVVGHTLTALKRRGRHPKTLEAGGHLRSQQAPEL